MSFLDNLLDHREHCPCGPFALYGDGSFDAEVELLSEDDEQFDGVALVRPTAESIKAALLAHGERWGEGEVAFCDQIECRGDLVWCVVVSRPDGWAP